MKRKYELKKRAERQLETRRRIVEAAIELHRTKGPARTTLSEVARLAGVQRHTLYSHFPDQRALGLACSGLYTERNPAPDPAAWLELEGEDRLRKGLSELYAYFERNEEMLSRLAVDAEVHQLTRELVELRRGPAIRETRRVLAQALPRRKAAMAMLAVALDFRTWQQLHRSGLTSRAAAEAMLAALLAQRPAATPVPSGRD